MGLEVLCQISRIINITTIYTGIHLCKITYGVREGVSYYNYLKEKNNQGPEKLCSLL